MTEYVSRVFLMKLCLSSILGLGSPVRAAEIGKHVSPSSSVKYKLLDFLDFNVVMHCSC